MKVKQYIQPLNALRGFAAIWVVLFHIYIFLSLNYSVKSSLSKLLFSRGYLAVDLFFILSGFVLMHVYAFKFQGKIKVQDYLSFIKNRLARIFPLHLGVLFILVMSESFTQLLRPPYTYHIPPFSGPYSPIHIVTNMFLVHAWHIHKDLTWNAPSWSISAEWFVYLLAPFLISLFSRLNSYTQIAAAFLISAGALLGLNVWLGKMDITTDYGSLRMLFEFCMGLSIYKIFDSCCEKAWKGLPDSVLLVNVILLGMLNFYWSSYFFSDYLTVLLFASLILFCALCRNRLQSYLGHPFLFHLGEISFSIYMIHYPLASMGLSLLNPIFHPEKMPIGLFSEIIIVLLSILVLAHLMYRFFEIPARDFIRNTMSSKNLKASVIFTRLKVQN